MANQHLHPLKQFNLKLLQVTIAIYISSNISTSQDCIQWSSRRYIAINMATLIGNFKFTRQSNFFQTKENYLEQKNSGLKVFIKVINGCGLQITLILTDVDWEKKILFCRSLASFARAR